MENLAEIKQLAHEIKAFAEKVIALEEPTVEVGQYWEWSTGKVFRVQEVYPETERCQIKYLNGVKTQYYWESIIDNATLLSDDEVQQALIEEAERRGFVAGQKIEQSHISTPGDGKHVLEKCKEDYSYGSQLDILFASHLNVYNKGDWAEIIEDEWEVEESHGGHYVSKGDRTIGEMNSGLSKQEAETIKKALNR